MAYCSYFSGMVFRHEGEGAMKTAGIVLAIFILVVVGVVYVFNKYLNSWRG